MSAEYLPLGTGADLLSAKRNIQMTDRNASIHFNSLFQRHTGGRGRSRQATALLTGHWLKGVRALKDRPRHSVPRYFVPEQCSTCLNM
jgi:hypothetical protein